MGLFKRKKKETSIKQEPKQAPAAPDPAEISFREYEERARKCNLDHDYKQAVMWQQKAIECGADKAENDAYYTLGWYYFFAGERRNEYEAYKKGAENCEPKSLMEMAKYYNEGLFFDKDENRAARYEMLAGDYGSEDGALRAGEYFEKGLKGFPKDDKKAFEYYKKSFEYFDSYKYNGVAAANLGKCYLLGIGTEADVQKGLDMLEQAACPEANYTLALYYGKKSVAEALKWTKIIGRGFKIKEIYPQMDELFKRYCDEKKYEERLPEGQHKILEDTESISYRIPNANRFMWKYAENFADTNLIKFKWCYYARELEFPDAAERMEQLYKLLLNDMMAQVRNDLLVHEEMKRNYFNPSFHSKSEQGLEWLLRVHDNAVANFYLGMIHNNKGKFEEAIKYFKAAMKSPDRDKYVGDNGKHLPELTKEALEKARTNLRNKLDLEHDIAVIKKDLDDFIEWLDEEIEHEINKGYGIDDLRYKF
ncbi:MAG TPA: sel1 repeat family protein [Candidatus Alectryocaccobium stercorigallinarum]|nr:sel1 repeat family protein [Candidatus Alectryocaccobium stercorigallinarum]